jgi:hypothetical protein
MSELLSTISLDDLPRPDQTDGKLIILLENDVTMNLILQRLEELGWTWINGGELPTEYKPHSRGKIQVGYFCKIAGKRVLAMNFLDQETLTKDGFYVYRLATTHRTKVVDLKVENTKLGATVCASCGGKLKNPMPGMLKFQHCPVCEP